MNRDPPIKNGEKVWKLAQKKINASPYVRMIDHVCDDGVQRKVWTFNFAGANTNHHLPPPPTMPL